MLEFKIDSNSPTTPLSHYWEKCVGSCHAYTALREDYRKQLRKVHEDLGFQYVRFHGLLDDDMSVVFRNRKGDLVYNFFNIDSIFDFLLSINMKPFIELGFMPEALASTATTCFHYKGNVSKPKDYGQWDELITNIIAHLIDRYGIAELRSWFFEVWNEPNLKFFYEGTQQDYFELYDHTVRAIKSVDCTIPVGGPATACNAWIPDLIRFCETNHTPLDFITTHHYPTDDPLWSSGMELDEAIEKMLKEKDKEAQEGNQKYYSRGILTKMIKKAKSESGQYPLYYTEWNSSAMLPDEIHDLPYSAALVAKTIIDNFGLVEAYSFWTFTDIFEEGGQLPGEFHGGFGLQTVHGIPKATYRTLQLLHQLGSEKLSVTEEQKTVGMIASAKDGAIRVIAYNHNVPDGEIESQQVRIILDEKKAKSAEITYVNENNGNSYKTWKDLGMPDYPNSQQMKNLYEASKMTPSKLEMKSSGNCTTLEFTLQPHSVAYIKIY